MKRIYKYPVVVGCDVALALPKGAQVLHAGEQGLALYIWALVDADNPPEARVFRAFGTGHDIDGVCREFIGTVQSGSGLVWHVFELEP